MKCILREHSNEDLNFVRCFLIGCIIFYLNSHPQDEAIVRLVKFAGKYHKYHVKWSKIALKSSNFLNITKNDLNYS